MSNSASERLLEARLKAGHKRMSSAARAAGIPYTTYVNYEKGERGLDTDSARRLARAFGVDPVWLLFGRGGATRSRGQIPVMGRVGAGAAIEPVQDGGWAEAIDHMDIPDPENLAIVIVSGESQHPRYRDGEAIIYDTRACVPEEIIGRYAICDMMDGRRLIKIVRRAGTGFWLESHNAEPEMDAQIIACYAVVGTLTGYASPFVRPGSKPRIR